MLVSRFRLQVHNHLNRFPLDMNHPWWANLKARVFPGRRKTRGKTWFFTDRLRDPNIKCRKQSYESNAHSAVAKCANLHSSWNAYKGLSPLLCAQLKKLRPDLIIESTPFRNTQRNGFWCHENVFFILRLHDLLSLSPPNSVFSLAQVRHL